MPVNLRRLFSFIAKEVKSSHDIQMSMHRIIDRCEKDDKNPDWNLIREIDFADTRNLFRVIKLPFSRKIRCELQCVYFGLFNPVIFRTPTAAFRVYGYERCSGNELPESPSVWSPTEPIRAVQLEQVYQIAYRDGGLGNNAEYPMALGFTALAIRDAFCTSKPTVFLKNAQSLKVFVGFDSGDCLLIGEHTRNGFHVT